MNDSQKRLRSLALAETGFLFDPSTGHTYTLNPTGARILCWLRDGTPAVELAGRLAAEFDVAAEEAELDVAAFLARLREYRLVE